MRNKRLSRILVIGAIAILSTQAMIRVMARPSTRPPIPTPKGTYIIYNDTMEMDLPGVEVKQVYRPEEVDLTDDHWVTGVVVDGRARAYLETGMDQPDTHIAHDNINGVNFTVAFCDHTGDGRVFCGDSNTLRSIRVGGWADHNLQLIIGDQRFSLDSQKIPLKELPFQSIKWSEWKALHPNTDIYLGNVLPQQR